MRQWRALRPGGIMEELWRNYGGIMEELWTEGILRNNSNDD